MIIQHPATSTPKRLSSATQKKVWPNVNLTWVGLGWVGLGWVGLGWVGLGWVGLGWVGLGWVGLGWVGLGWVGLGWVGGDQDLAGNQLFASIWTPQPILGPRCYLQLSKIGPPKGQHR